MPSLPNFVRRPIRFLYRLVRPVVDVRATLVGALNYPRYFWQLFRYASSPAAEKGVSWSLYPLLCDATISTPFDAHYLYLGDWALRLLLKSPAWEHVDVASQLHWVAAVAAIKKVTFVDIRPAGMDIENLTVIAGSLMKLPFADRSVESVSCLHVVEHIGLGRYGDPLDPEGTTKAIAELARIVAPQGTLLLALPVGRPQIAFNAHRVHSPSGIVQLAGKHGLKLKSFAVVGDDRTYHRMAQPGDFENCDFACGMYEFTR